MLLCSVLYVVVFDVAHEQTRAMPPLSSPRTANNVGSKCGKNERLCCENTLEPHRYRYPRASGRHFRDLLIKRPQHSYGYRSSYSYGHSSSISGACPCHRSTCPASFVHQSIGQYQVPPKNDNAADDPNTVLDRYGYGTGTSTGRLGRRNSTSRT